MVEAGAGHREHRDYREGGKSKRGILWWLTSNIPMG
jgi:hypothetical protein